MTGKKMMVDGNVATKGTFSSLSYHTPLTGTYDEGTFLCFFFINFFEEKTQLIIETGCQNLLGTRAGTVDRGSKTFFSVFH